MVSWKDFLSSHFITTGFFFPHDRKLSIFVLLLAAAAVKSQDELPDYPVQCDFRNNYNGYACRLENLELMFPNVNIVFEGEHLDGRTDADVVEVEILDSMVTYIIPSMFTQFENLEFLDIYRTSLAYLQFPNVTNNLREIYIVGGMIDTIENSTFVNSPSLERLSIRESGIVEIEENAFEGLERLQFLSLIGNHIRRIPQRALHDIPNAYWIDFERNNLTRVEASSFAESRNLTNLWLERNQIVDVEGTFTEAFRERIFLINLSGNLCTDRSFTFSSNEQERGSEFTWFNMVMSQCYNNFAAGPNGLRRVTLELDGPMSFFDAFGNLVLRVN